MKLHRQRDFCWSSIKQTYRMISRCNPSYKEPRPVLIPYMDNICARDGLFSSEKILREMYIFIIHFLYLFIFTFFA